MTPTFF